MNNEIEIVGRKVFFVSLDTALMPEEFLEDFLVEGFECHLVLSDSTSFAEKKVPALMERYPGAVFFFYIDAPSYGFGWKNQIHNFGKAAPEETLLGVLYDARTSRNKHEELEKEYVWDLGIRSGCIGLTENLDLNAQNIKTVLSAQKANGRRKTARALCDESSRLAFSCNGKRYVARLIDVSISHFSCELTDEIEGLDIYKKLQDVSITANGMQLTNNAVLIMKRTSGNQKLYIFMFIKHDGIPGLNEGIYPKLKHKIYEIISKKIDI